MADRREVEAVGPGLSASQGKQLVELHNECIRLRAELRRAERERDEALENASDAREMLHRAEARSRDRQEVEAVEAVVEKARWYGGVMANWQIERVAVDAIAALDRVRAERAESEGMVKLADVLAHVRLLPNGHEVANALEDYFGGHYA